MRSHLNTISIDSLSSRLSSRRHHRFPTVFEQFSLFTSKVLFLVRRSTLLLSRRFLFFFVACCCTDSAVTFELKSVIPSLNVRLLLLLTFRASSRKL